MSAAKKTKTAGSGVEEAISQELVVPGKMDPAFARIAALAKEVSKMSPDEMTKGDVIRMGVMESTGAPGSGGGPVGDLPPDMVPVPAWLGDALLSPTQAKFLVMLHDLIQQAPGRGTDSYDSTHQVCCATAGLPEGAAVPHNMYLFSHYPADMYVAPAGMDRLDSEKWRTERGGAPALEFFVQSVPGGPYVRMRATRMPPVSVSALDLGTGNARPDAKHEQHRTPDQGSYYMWANLVNADGTPSYHALMYAYVMTKFMYMSEAFYMLNAHRCTGLNGVDQKTYAQLQKPFRRIRSDNIRLNEAMEEEGEKRDAAVAELAKALVARRKRYDFLVVRKEIVTLDNDSRPRMILTLRRTVKDTPVYASVLQDTTGVIMKRLRGNKLHPADEWPELQKRNDPLLRNVPMVYSFDGVQLAGPQLLLKDPNHMCGTDYGIRHGAMVVPDVQIHMYPSGGICPSIWFKSIIVLRKADWVPRLEAIRSIQSGATGPPAFTGTRAALPGAYTASSTGALTLAPVEEDEDLAADVAAGAGSGSGSGGDGVANGKRGLEEVKTEAPEGSDGKRARA